MNIDTFNSKQVDKGKKVNRVFVLLLILLTGVSVFTGIHDLEITHILRMNEIQHIVMYSTRIPRTVSLILSGGMLAVCGLLMQQLTQNRFISPATSGTMASARLGVVIAVIFYSHESVKYQTIVAFIFAVGGTACFMLFVRSVRNKKALMIPLVGIMFGNIISSVSTYLALQYEVVQQTSTWLQGNFSLISSSNYKLLYLSVPLFFCVCLFVHHFTIMGLGEVFAESLGVAYGLLETVGLIIVAIATSAVVLTVGSIPFVGIIIPNLVALKKGDHFASLVLPTALSGAVFLLAADILSRVLIYPYEIPISVIAGSVGSVVFLYLLIRKES
ncbi:putative iron compound ABC uptake transporter, permease protein [Alkalibacterium sp. AK22]|uniref:ABC transporter permease n=1 Tax=Alkalibacterium sp. AK22 TaxID=1229520 RepID=UPI000448B211|nr:iron chelate uptake ABC transporter family permease subunit [Alkalibacterium sp. AK22]EXJ22840.1 putative iron compound ABC uptake transporter, permease protein [Alkalibacterium sp. AK22]